MITGKIVKDELTVNIDLFSCVCCTCGLEIEPGRMARLLTIQVAPNRYQQSYECLKHKRERVWNPSGRMTNNTIWKWSENEWYKEPEKEG